MPDVRLATPSDRDAVLTLVGDLLVELGGTPPSASEMAPAFDVLVAEGDAGFIVIGETEGTAVSVCTVSFVESLRSRGRYAVFQEMYVKPEARSSGVGMAALRFALEHSMAAGCRFVELGTPFPESGRSSSIEGRGLPWSAPVFVGAPKSRPDNSTLVPN